MRCVLVSHFHWDREWYRTFEAYRARLVDAVDRVLELLDADPGYRFLLDGQAIVLEDYLAIRPERRTALAAAIRAGRLAVGPWYVQPDSLLPSGEAHVRNLLHGRQVAETLGPASRVGYVPDSFGHPAQLPQLLLGFGITSFVYWRGNGDELDALGPVYRWEAPDGSAVTAVLLREGYFNAACLPADPEEAARRLADGVRRLGESHDGPVLLMNGFDHMLPDPHTGAVAAALAQATGAVVERGLLEDVVARPGPAGGTHRGPLLGARLANLLPGVWSTRMPLKLANRRCEALLEGWADPWAALAHALGAPDERPALAVAWRTLLQNHAHDSICGCSTDAVAAKVASRFADVEELASETVDRLLARLAGLGVERRVPWTVEQEVAVFNPSPHPRTDVVRIPLDAYPALRLPAGLPEFAPLLLASADAPGFAVDGKPARLVPADDPRRVRWLPGQEPCDLEVVVRDVPAFGYRRLRLTPIARVPETEDDGRDIRTDAAGVALEDDGALGVDLAGRRYRGLLGVEDRGDRGDTYDFDPVDGAASVRTAVLTARRYRHRSGILRLVVRRVLQVPAALDDARERRTGETPLMLQVEARLIPAVPRVDLRVALWNGARDHRLRLLFPTGAPATRWHAASTFDATTHTADRPDAARWLHPAPATFAHQGWVAANGLMVVAPGLPEAEVTADGTIALTLVRAVGWLARYDLRTRPIPAGPAMPAPGAQVVDMVEARLALLPGPDPVAARDAELGLRATVAGDRPLVGAGVALLELEPRDLVLSAVKPAENGGGVLVRVLNPTDTARTAVLRVGFPVRSAQTVRFDEEPARQEARLEGDVVRFPVPPRGVRSVMLDPFLLSSQSQRRHRRGARGA